MFKFLGGKLFFHGYDLENIKQKILNIIKILYIFKLFSFYIDKLK